MTTYAQALTEDRRLVMLRGLHSAASYRTNALLLRRYAEAVGHTASADQVETDLAWLAEQGLLTTERVSGVTVATLTQRGADVASGATVVPGVQRPQPGF